MKNILIGQIDYLNFKDRETIRSTRIICATRNTIDKLSLYIYMVATSFSCYTKSYSAMETDD
jgi:hypothetical protein